MPSEKGSKPRSPKGFGPLACAVLVISAKRKHTYSTLGLLRPSIWFASSPGLMVTCQLQHGYQPMKGCTLPLRGFTSSVLWGESRSSQTEAMLPLYIQGSGRQAPGGGDWNLPFSPQRWETHNAIMLVSPGIPCYTP